MVYIKLLYIKNDRKEFNKEFELFFEEYQNKKDFSIKKFIVNYGLIYLIKEFEGKTGKGYIFKEYNMKKQAIKESKEKTKDLIEKKDREEYIKLYIESKKEKFFKKYLDKIIDMIILDKNLIIVGDNLRCLCILSQNIDDEPASDELKLKLFKLSLELKNDILNINDSILLDHYYDIIWLYSKFCYDNIMNDYDVFSIEFIKKNKEEFKKLESKAVSVLKDIAEKYKELTGKDDEKEKIKCFRIPALQSAFYKDLLAPIETYREYKEKYKVYDYQILEICRGWFIYFNQSAFSILNNDLKEKELITVFNELYNDFEELVKYTFNNYKILNIL